MSPQPFWRATPEGLTLHLRLTPKGGRDAIEGVELLSDGRSVLKARVRAAPEDGKANDALIKLIAKMLAVGGSKVRIETGHSARLKTVAIRGEPARLVKILDEATKFSKLSPPSP